jgi:hypothetical protein
MLRATVAQSVQRLATGCKTKGSEFESRWAKTFNFSISSRQVLRPTQPPIQWVRGAFYVVLKRQGSEADHSPPTVAEVKKTWIYTSTPRLVFMVQCFLS